MAVATDPAIEALLAAGPAAEYADKLMLYGRFVGDWDFDWTGFDADGNETLTTRGEWLFTWVLRGRAVQDVWICPARDLYGAPGAPAEREYGTTIRFYDAKIDAWHVVWAGPGFGNLRTFVASARGEEIVQEGRSHEGRPMQWIFSDIEGDSFTWRSQELVDGRWRLRERMAVRRR
jgi:hypothetical protein